GQRHQAGAGLDDVQVELLGDAIAEVGCADLRDRQAAGGHHDITRQDGFAVRGDTEQFALLFHAGHLARHAPADAARIALGFQHADDLLGRVVAEQLA
nr:hypothetical protein [Tanacetum cinerariifolium]